MVLCGVDKSERSGDFCVRFETVMKPEGPVMMGLGRRKVCFIRDPDLNVLEFNEIFRAPAKLPSTDMGKPVTFPPSTSG